MSLEELNQRLDKLIGKIGDNIVKTTHSMYVEPVFPSPVEREMMRLNNGRLEKESTTSVLSSEATKEWKELFEDYKRLINDPESKEFTEKFYNLTKKCLFQLFNPFLMINQREFYQWYKLHKKEK